MRRIVPEKIGQPSYNEYPTTPTDQQNKGCPIFLRVRPRERGFGFLKDPLFFTDSIFIKSPERIEALAMIMGLCLLVYTLAQRQIRAALSASKSTINNQLGKSINNPTLRWVFECFQSIHLVTFNQETDISNLTPERNFILTFFPESCRIYYNCVT